ncbi:hypothetical protein E2C01_020149 [Portunus trituberculatus]|uniref:Uncharacterized protein n=1 Tax=Portunus trituberculatus TaxID=210409 RepID=A0A5B7E0J0_PORTR|nr:hypothetical protein [Portunus trituberculatus]
MHCGSSCSVRKNEIYRGAAFPCRRATRAGRLSSRLALAARRLFDVKRLEITFYSLTNAQTLATVSSSGSGVWLGQQCGESSNAAGFTQSLSPILPPVPLCLSLPTTCVVDVVVVAVGVVVVVLGLEHTPQQQPRLRHTRHALAPLPLSPSWVSYSRHAVNRCPKRRAGAAGMRWECTHGHEEVVALELLSLDCL